MLRVRVKDAAVNCVTLGIDLKGNQAARIYRSRRASGPYEEVGLARDRTYIDSADLEPGRTYFYRAVAWSSQWLHPEPEDLMGGRPVDVEVPRAPKERRVTLTRKRQEFTVNMGGYLDESNTVTKGPEVGSPGPGHSNPPYDQVFEPNMYVAIENEGETDVVNPWLVANDQRDWWSEETTAREILRIAGGRRASETEKAMAIWQFVVDEVYDSRAGLSWHDSVADPVKLVNSYGFEGCVANAVGSRRLAEAMGVEAREVWMGGLAFVDGHGRGRCCDHDIFEASTDGSWHFLDTDLMVFFLNRDNQTVAGSEDLSRDIDLLRRSHRNLGLCGRDMPEKVFYYSSFQERKIMYPPNKGNALSGPITHSGKRFPRPHTMAVCLRPGEKLMRYWGNVGKNVVSGSNLHPDVRFSNGKLVYRPKLRQPLALKGMEGTRNVKQEASRRHPALHPERTGKVSEVVWKIESPYPIPGARVGISCRRETPEDGLELLFSRDGRNWRSFWVPGAIRSGAETRIGSRVNDCPELEVYFSPSRPYQKKGSQDWGEGPYYAYYIKLAMWAVSRPEAVGLDEIRFDTDIQCSTRSLPSLFCGKNKIVYRDENSGRRKVRVTYGWQEEGSIRPPGAPALTYPGDGADVNRLDFEFRWKRPKGGSGKVDDYHVQVSRYEDFRWCVCPTFNRYVGRTKYAGKTRWQAEFPNLLNPDEQYYWRVRARNAKGVWGKWSEGRSFVPHGPRLPQDLEVKRARGGSVLAWKANPEGSRAVEYRVHGSKESGGFSAGRENLLGEVEGPIWPLKKAKKGMSYRVVAVDARGVPSTPSEHVEF